MSWISEPQLGTAAQAVRRNLARFDLWSPRLDRVSVFWCPVPQLSLTAMAFFLHRGLPGTGLLGYVPGHIYFPAFSFFERPLADVLTHEFAHALAHHHPGLIQRSPKFTEAFGGRYFYPAGGRGMRRADCVSDYALTCPMEDFAETFARYVRRKGRLPAKATRRLRSKWEFIAHLRATLG